MALKHSQLALTPARDLDSVAPTLRQADFARLMGVSRQAVGQWVQKGVVTLGADGRLDPQYALRQLLGQAHPDRIRARVVRQAYGDMGDLRAQAAKVVQLEEQIADLQAEQAREAGDYDRIDGWLNAFEARVADIPLADRAALDADAWRTHVRDLLLAIMEPPEDTFADLDRQIEADLRALSSGEAVGVARNSPPGPVGGPG